jgi:polygalacturonase
VSAITAANDPEGGVRNEVVIPEGYWFSIMPVVFDGIKNVNIRIDGEVLASKRHTHYPFTSKYKGEDKGWSNELNSIFDLPNASGVKISGKGQVDGRGFMWWNSEFLVNNPLGRPNLVEMRYGENVEFTGVRWVNSPHFYLFCRDITNFTFHDFEIYTDHRGQLVLAQLFGQHDWMGDGFISIPTFPLNTDGIDVAGSNILIERVNITNFDDAVAIKPLSGSGVKA